MNARHPGPERVHVEAYRDAMQERAALAARLAEAELLLTQGMVASRHKGPVEGWSEWADRAERWLSVGATEGQGK